MRRLPLLICAGLAVGATACGSSGGTAATAKEGDAFCKAADTANTDNDALDSLDFTDPAQVKLQLPAAIDSLSAAVAKAPKDIADTAKELLTREEAIEAQLQKNDWDVVKTQASPEGKKAFDDMDKSTAPADFRNYLKDKCGIVSTSDTTGDTTPSDTTGDTTPSDTTGDTTASTEPAGTIDLGSGEDAINKFLDLYEIGTGQQITDEQRACVIDALDKANLSGDDLEKAMNGQADTAVEQALGLAFISCNIVNAGG
jgi:hypothetical protein